ncbi:MAG: sulfatase, partial [Planctomycetaceae bacterium]|nr:sulfatase [Planctomycetaceae bacterium]
MTHSYDKSLRIARRHFFNECGIGVGKMALAGLLSQQMGNAAFGAIPSAPENPLAPRPPHFPAKAKSVIY